MELRDLIVTPILIIIVYIVAYIIRPYVANATISRYFLFALTTKIIGALALGVVYQFYYSGGDTYIYHSHGSRQIWEAFMDSPTTGIRLFFANGKIESGLYDYMEKIWYYRDQRAYFIIRIAFLFDLITFSTYSATAVLFSLLSFTGCWMLFVTFYKIYPEKHKLLALACFFIPSVIFWGSGILKDTITLACIGVMAYEIQRLFVFKKISLLHIFLLILSGYCLFEVRKFVLQAFIPAAIVWICASNLGAVRSLMLKAMLVPFIALVMIGFSFYFVNKVGEGDQRYALDRIAETSRVTAYDIRYWTGKEAGSGYTLGELDGTVGGMIKLAPEAINVTLFRPYLWEISNVLMALSSLEATLFLLLFLYSSIRWGRNWTRNWKLPEVLFCTTFVLIFAFAAGVSTYNFGSLARYKIPILPFYCIALILLSNHSNQTKTTDNVDNEMGY